jgi:hypothetical protein
LEDFAASLASVRPSVDAEDIKRFDNWNRHFGDVS